MLTVWNTSNPDAMSAVRSHILFTDAFEFDYKKLSLNKLKSIVVERGLVQDSSKLKKHELLKLLNVE
jgi:hypothetical protein